MNQIFKNNKIKIVQAFLASLCFLGGLPLHASVEHANNEEEGIVAIHFGPGDADLVATEDSKIDSDNTTHSEN